jgi:transposase
MTTTWRRREGLILVLVALSRQGLSTRALACTLGLSRRTVRRLLAAYAAPREQRISTEKDTAA